MAHRAPLAVESRTGVGVLRLRPGAAATMSTRSDPPAIQRIIGREYTASLSGGICR
jgi:hypothetical protein